MTGQLVHRMVDNFLAALIVKKQGVTDPHYLNPEILGRGKQ
jgi:hypothetical protein